MRLDRKEGPEGSRESIVVQSSPNANQATSTADAPALKTGVPTPEAVEESAGEVFDRAFAEAGTTRAAVVVAFQGILGDLPRGPEREDRLRDICKAAMLATARAHGNLIETGRTVLANIDELGVRLMLDVARCKDQMLLGLAEGACQVGPIVYGRFLDIAGEYRDNADEWITQNKRRAAPVALESLPVIVPFENSLTLNARPFAVGLNIQSSTNPPAPPRPLSAMMMAGLSDLQVEPPVAPTVKPWTLAEGGPVSPPEVEVETPTTSEPEGSKEQAARNADAEQADQRPPTEWSRPKGKGFFRRLSDVMAGLFGRG